MLIAGQPFRLLQWFPRQFASFARKVHRHPYSTATGLKYIPIWDNPIIGSASAAMTTRARKLDKSVHSGGQAAFCELMIKARKTAGLTQHDVAKRLHRPQSFVAKYEGGERRVDVVEFVEICRAIEADPQKLLKLLIQATPIPRST
jgi:hypothetical protein